MSRPKGSLNKATIAREGFLTAPTDLATGLTEDVREAMDTARLFAEAEKRIEAERLPENFKKMILQEIKVDTYTTIRRYVELTPSMCDARNCGYDAAKAQHNAGWDAAPLDQVMPDGKTYGEKLIEMKEYHKATAHPSAYSDSYIVTEDDLKKKGGWATGGANVNFLTAAK